MAKKRAEGRTLEKLKANLAEVDRQLQVLEARRVALFALLDTYRPGWKPPQNVETTGRLRHNSSMNMVREALVAIGREATMAEIRSEINRAFVDTPASSLSTMVFREASQERSGLYRIPGPDRFGRYGLLAWREPKKQPPKPQ